MKLGIIMVFLAPWLCLHASELNKRDVQSSTIPTSKPNEVLAYISNFQGEPNWRRPPKNIEANLLSDQGNVTALVVLAENYQDEAQSVNNKYCKEPFAKNTFNGEIVVCQQSDIASHLLADNLKAAGASGMIIQAMSLANKKDAIGNSIPSISLSVDSYFLLKNWVNHSKPGTAIATIGG